MYWIEDMRHNRFLDLRNEEQSGDNKSSSNEEVKEEDKSEFNESTSPNKSNKKEKDNHHAQSVNSLFIEEIKEPRNYFKVFVEWITITLNIIANYIWTVKCQELVFKTPQVVSQLFLKTMKIIKVML